MVLRYQVCGDLLQQLQKTNGIFFSFVFVPTQLAGAIIYLVIAVELISICFCLKNNKRPECYKLSCVYSYTKTGLEAKC